MRSYSKVERTLTLTLSPVGEGTEEAFLESRDDLLDASSNT